MIPKIIHQTWKDFNIPDDWQKNQQTWIKNHPDWQYMYWTDTDNLRFLQTHYPFFVETYNAYPNNIQRADAIRPFLLYHYGGMYVDMDMICLKPFDDVFLKDGVYLVQSSNVTKYASNMLMASSKGHNFWKLVINNMLENIDKHWYHNRHMYIMSSTGPTVITNSYYEYKKHKNDIYLMDYTKFNPCSVCDKACDVNSHIYSISTNASSWVKDDAIIMLHVFCNYKQNKMLYHFVLLIILLLIVKFVFIRKGKRANRIPKNKLKPV